MFKKIGIFLVALVSYTNADSDCEDEVVGYVTFYPGKLNMWTVGGQWQHESIDGPGSASPMGECITDSEDAGKVQFGSSKTWGGFSDYCDSKYPLSEQGEGKMVTNTFYDADHTPDADKSKCVYECVKCVEPPVDCCDVTNWGKEDCFGSASANQLCCKAMTATCLACAAGVTPHEYCQKCFVQGCKINEFVSRRDPASLSKAYRSLGLCGLDDEQS